MAGSSSSTCTTTRKVKGRDNGRSDEGGRRWWKGDCGGVMVEG